MGVITLCKMCTINDRNLHKAQYRTHELCQPLFGAEEEEAKEKCFRGRGEDSQHGEIGDDERCESRRMGLQ